MAAIRIADLDNAKRDVDHIAEIATSTKLSATDRLGRTKRTIAGAEVAINEGVSALQTAAVEAVATTDAALAGIGYQPPVAYASGLNMNQSRQTVTYGGQTYAPIVTELPFTTSGTFEAAKFRLIQGVSGADLMASTGAAIVGFKQAGTGAVVRDIAAKLREMFVSVTDYGAQGDGVTDDSAAVERAIAAVRSLNGASPTTNGGIKLYWPKGRYRVRRSVLSYNPTAALWGPMSHVGDGPYSSVLELDPPTAAETWLYDSAPVARGGDGSSFQRLSFTGLGFRGVGANKAHANGFRYYSTGYEKNFKFDDCAFAVGDDGAAGDANLNVLMYACGTGNADQVVFDKCFISRVSDCVLKLNNNQSIGFDFFGTQAIAFSGDLIRILSQGVDPNFGPGGGGMVRWIGGCINQSQSIHGKERWLVSTVGGGSSLHTTLYFNPDQIELDNEEGRIFKKDGVNGHCKVAFESAKFDAIDPISTDYTVVDIAEGGTLTFKNCALRSNMVFNIQQLSSGSGNIRAEPGSVFFDSCSLPRDITKRFTFGGAAYRSSNFTVGRFTARRCLMLPGDSAALNTAYGTYAHGLGEFDVGWELSIGSGRSPQVKFAPLMHAGQTWPRLEADSRGTVLPYNSTIVGFAIYRPAAGSNTDPYRLAVGSDDRSLIYAQSTLAQYKDAHMIDIDLPPDQWVFVGLDDNKRKVELWASVPGGPSALAASASVALVKYL